jgi:hypothetical protein
MKQVECIKEYYDTLLKKTIEVGEKFEVNEKRMKTLIDNEVAKEIKKEIKKTDK